MPPSGSKTLDLLNMQWQLKVEGLSIKKLAHPNAECRLRLPAVGRECGI